MYLAVYGSLTWVIRSDGHRVTPNLPIQCVWLTMAAGSKAAIRFHTLLTESGSWRYYPKQPSSSSPILLCKMPFARSRNDHSFVVQQVQRWVGSSLRPHAKQ